MALNVIKNRFIYLTFSCSLFVLSILALLFWHLNLWIEMTWWTQWEYKYEWNVDLEKIKEKIEVLKNDFNSENQDIINWFSVYKVNWENILVLETWFNNTTDEKTLEWYKTSFNSAVLKTLWTENNSFTLSKYQNIWKSFWEYIKKTAIITLIISCIAISVYLWYAFSWVAVWISSMSFALITLLTLFHDVVIPAWFYILTSSFFPEYKIDTYFVTALLTILWYSINDTIIIFDRIRENIKFYVKTKKLDEIIDLSINETLARSIFTSLTLFFVLVAIFFFGPISLRWFMLALIYWVVFWTYSSIFVASPILYEISKNKKLQVYEKKEVKVEDKIIV